MKVVGKEAEIIKAYKEGKTLRQVGEEFGISHMRVKQIVDDWEYWDSISRKSVILAIKRSPGSKCVKTRSINLLTDYSAKPTWPALRKLLKDIELGKVHCGSATYQLLREVWTNYGCKPSI